MGGRFILSLQVAKTDVEREVGMNKVRGNVSMLANSKDWFLNQHDCINIKWNAKLLKEIKKICHFDVYISYQKSLDIQMTTNSLMLESSLITKFWTTKCSLWKDIIQEINKFWEKCSCEEQQFPWRYVPISHSPHLELRGQARDRQKTKAVRLYQRAALRAHASECWARKNLSHSRRQEVNCQS